MQYPFKIIAPVQVPTIVNGKDTIKHEEKELTVIDSHIQLLYGQSKLGTPSVMSMGVFLAYDEKGFFHLVQIDQSAILIM